MDIAEDIQKQVNHLDGNTHNTKIIRLKKD